MQLVSRTAPIEDAVEDASSFDEGSFKFIRQANWRLPFGDRFSPSVGNFIRSSDSADHGALFPLHSLLVTPVGYSFLKSGEDT